ncbi:MAG: hypothetical protein ACREVY_01985 [Gammaproteobacteria bacterium]
MGRNIDLSVLDGMHNMQLVRFDRCDSARKYISDTLANGGVLSNKLLSVLDLGRGRIFAPLPEGANTNLADRYRCGGVLPQLEEQESLSINKNGRIVSVRQTPTLEPFLKDVVLGYIHDQKERIVVLEDPIARPSDRKLTDNHLLSNHTLRYKKEIYYSLGHDCAPDVVDIAIRTACTSWHFLGVFITTVGIAELDGVITEKMLDHLCVSNAFAIVVGAYDGEGFIFWASDLPNGAELERCIVSTAESTKAILPKG